MTTVPHNMKEGEIMGVRGPLGNSYPLEELEGPKVWCGNMVFGRSGSCQKNGFYVS